jgi:acyl-coenzyme A synthetase/AMP-(fatty) acid ligase
VLKQHNSHWQLNCNQPQQVVLLDDDAALCWYDWQQLLHSALAEAARYEGDAVLLYQPDSQQFSLWFIALALLGKHIILAPDNQPATLALVQQHCDWQVPDTPLQPAANIRYLPALELSPHCRVSFFTSGSTGAAKLISKQLHQLLCEVQTLEQQFGAELAPQAVFAGTVSQQHIYGLLFRVLWPLCCGRPFYRRQLSFFEQWKALLQWHKVVLIASPAHLARFDDIAALAPLQQQVQRIFSSGGPLADSVPALYYQALAQAPLEVFGSTETGGIAFRQRSQADTPWQVFNGITLSQDARGALIVQSPYLENGAPFQTQDHVLMLGPQQFRLLGRLDRIVKVEEKRLALPELEQFCHSSALVSAAAAVVVKQPKVQLALVVVLSAAGTALLHSAGKAAVNQQLKQHLLQRFERVVLPKRFRYVTALPYNQQGKLPQPLLEALFTDD